MRYHQFIAGWDAEDESFEWEDGRIRQGGTEIVPQAVFDDELLDYLYDTFRWIRAQYPDGSEGNGLGSGAYSVIRGRDEIRKLRGMAQAWKNLFGVGPERMTLTGNYGWTADPQNGTYEKLFYRKEDLIERFEDLTRVAEHALENGMDVIRRQVEEEDEP
ncbi:hypothetical protein [Saccharibacillus alkalitolerans]|uniref:Phage ABA sandwich domain-containing protein n=1 Tax=Saccharibacillus alkalitolerans TaxID=2705290 RepID=A0ABX0F9G5_9BACL|nr:hypothetical protein [Saccharibacillus alkalitolerans]NGZ76963.1 hypothetical protein [Saccharibacillus alkalitolerans]